MDIICIVLFVCLVFKVYLVLFCDALLILSLGFLFVRQICFGVSNLYLLYLYWNCPLFIFWKGFLIILLLHVKIIIVLFSSCAKFWYKEEECLAAFTFYFIFVIQCDVQDNFSKWNILHTFWHRYSNISPFIGCYF